MSRLKFAAALGTLAAGIATTSALAPVLNKKSTLVEPQSSQQSPKIVKPSSKPSNLNPSEELKGISTKFQSLKQTSLEFKSHVENSISSYKNLKRQVTNYKELESKFVNCRKKIEMDDAIGDEEKKQLKELSGVIEQEISKFEGYLKESQELSVKTDKDSNKTKDGYQELQKEFKNLTTKYNETVDGLSGEKFMTHFTNIKTKLENANNECDFKDVIRLNDLLGQQNDRKWVDKD